MIGLVLVTHGNLAKELLNAMEHIVGAQAQCRAIAIGPDDDMERRRSDIERWVQKLDTGAGVIILTDMFGGTPSNLAISVMGKGKVEVVAGVNLPMLVRLAGLRGKLELGPAAAQAAAAGRKYITLASEVLDGKKA